MNEPQTARGLHLSTTVRGLIIGALLLFYGWLVKQPGASLAVGLLIAVAFQVAVLLLRRHVPRDQLPMALYIFALLVDAATVLAFALAVAGHVADFGMQT